MTIPTLNFLAILPVIILIVAAMVVLLLDLTVRDKRALGWLSLLSVVLALAATLALVPLNADFQQMYLADGMSRVLGSAVLVAAGLAVFLSIDRATDFTRWVGAYYSLLLLATCGMTVMIGAINFITIFLGLEILSLALYVLAGFNRGDVRSGEAALKYFLLGAFASGFFLYGIALVYGATGSIQLASLNSGGAGAPPLPGIPLLAIGMGLLIVGFGFKVALVPFHMWTPDVYQGAPTPLVAFMSVATKAAAFAALIRVLVSVALPTRPWLLALAVLAVLTMTLGNLAALRQNSVKRLLAYSSIAQAGYVLTGLAAGNPQGVQGALYYLVVYTFMNIGAFAVVLVLQYRDEMDITMERLVGLSRRQPGLAALMAVFMFSLTGVPPLAGFFGKLYVFSAAVQGGLAWLAVIGVLNSAIAAYYYLRVTVTMYMAEPAPEPVTGGVPTPATTQPGRAPRPVERPARSMAGERTPTVPAVLGASTTPLLAIRPGAAVRTSWPIWAALALACLGTILLGLWQAPLVQSITQAVASLALRQ